MKKIISLLLAVVAISTCLLSCKKNYDKEAEAAFEDIRGAWEELYKTSKVEMGEYINIVYTQISKIKPDCEIEMLKDIDLIIEFQIMSNYHGYGGKYQSNVHMYDTVVFYKDGTHEAVAISPLRAYMSKEYDAQFEEFLEVVYAGDKYNTDLNITGKNK
jgi:hypothetical protein